MERLGVESLLQQFAAAGEIALLTSGQIGLEKEGLRVDSQGKIAQTPHPAAFGSALFNPRITTDYSEALLELITPPCSDAAGALAYLTDIHRFVQNHLGDELLWNASMPCVVDGEDKIPLARYGSSNAGKMKTVYRRGLGYRYGRTMQVIAGIHFNYSFSQPFWERYQQISGDRQSLPTFIAERSFALLRNLQRVGWLIPYLFGASPTICKSFLGGASTNLDHFDDTTYYGPFATSLRMGDIGYQNNKGNDIGVKACYDNLQEYVDTLNYAIETSYPGYTRMGVKVNGEYRQLNDKILQIENEYYSTVRPKQILIGNEMPTHALMRRGIAYIELRSLDINPFAPAGIDLNQLLFLELLFIYALLTESPAIAPWERGEIDKNEMEAAHNGRKYNIKLQRNGEMVPLRQWGEEILDTLAVIADYLDRQRGGIAYATALKAPGERVANPDETLSAKMLREMIYHNEGFFSFSERHSREAQRQLQQPPLSVEREAYFNDLVQRSLEAQQRQEAEDDIDFDEYLRRYFAQTLLVGGR
ncbi:MAG: glutamate--cysteine ligase [Gammaproteobacteria bacterium]|nr:glutamate--cysteine ligase [Gammaproteobacteria bacterium]